MSIALEIVFEFILMVEAVWLEIFHKIYEAIGAVPIVIFAFILNLIFIYFLGRFIQADSNSDGVRKSSKRKSGGEE